VIPKAVDHTPRQLALFVGDLAPFSDAAAMAHRQCRLIGTHPSNGERTHANHRSPELISTKPSARSGS
jgi:hypothetical protein